MSNILNKVKINAEETLGDKLLLLEIRPYASYKEGIRGENEGLVYNCLSEALGFEKIDVKVAGSLTPPFEFEGTPVPVIFENVSIKLWQDWSNKGAVKLSVSATAIRPRDSKRIKIGDDK